MWVFLTCACVKRTRRFLLWLSGNCIGLVSLQAPNEAMLDMLTFMPVEPVISRETVDGRER